MLVPSIFNDNFVGDFLDEMFMKPFGYGQSNARYTAMNTDIQEFDDKYELDLELPGFSKEDLQAELKDGYLTIHANHTENSEEKDENGKFIRQERYTGECHRSFFVGKEVTQEDIKAKFENGILKLQVPKKESKPAIENKHFIAID